MQGTGQRQNQQEKAGNTIRLELILAVMAKTVPRFAPSVRTAFVRFAVSSRYGDSGFTSHVFRNERTANATCVSHCLSSISACGCVNA